MEEDFSKWELDFINKIKSYADSFKNRNDAADSLGISLGTLNSYYYMYRHPKVSSAQTLLEKMGVPSQSMIKRIGENAVPETLANEICTVPVIAQAGAGLAFDFWNTEPITEIKILPKYYHKDIRVFEVAGDSMEPTIRKGSYAAVVPFDGNFSEGAIYLVRLPYFGFTIKRIKPDKQGGIILISDNPSYETVPIPYEGYEDIIIGKVVWYLQEA